MMNRRHGTLYTGVTGRLVDRIYEHREGLVEGFTTRYGLKRLVWFEMHEGIVTAIQREKSIKKYRRDWKINLIERDNPQWEDLFPMLIAEQGPLSHLQKPDWR
jgi:putative endonuclease